MAPEVATSISILLSITLRPQCIQIPLTSPAVVGMHHRELVAAPSNRYHLGIRILVVGRGTRGMSPAAGTLVVGRRDTPVGRIKIFIQ